MAEPIISVSGLRGVIGESLTPPGAMRFVAAFVAELPPGPIVVTRDGRATGKLLAKAIHCTVGALGRDVIDADTAATPTTGVLVKKYGAAGGIQISASHNPPEYNGIKLFSDDGRVFTAVKGEAVLARYRNSQPAWSSHEAWGECRRCEDTTTQHLQRVLEQVDVEAIRRQAFRVLLDSNHGAGSILGRRLLAELGCQTVFLGDTPDGQFAHPPEPTAENLAGVRSAVVEASAAVGFCQDPDADRLALIDEQGRYIGEEYTLALCLDHVLQSRKGAVVANCATSRMNQDITEQHGSTYFRSAVGEANVADLMQAQQAVFGGEGNGGPIDPQVGYVRDSFVGMAFILDGLAARGGMLSSWADALPRYEIHKTKISLPPEKIPAGLAALQQHFADAEASLLDGLRLDWPDRWLLVRASNTEPIVRAIAEAKTLAAAEELCATAAQVLSQV
ncbi:phosphoglucosamine mutase [Lignipirellula cremea]|uniref:Phosphoglucosamine mutase n=1 Tax=Lignipirellula cremea TaxID=2528010 RepID=A0A518DQB2_9BACT|nr:phosphoglucosamine mutase [Lignipirellula cremea]QDU94004.1 Phosphoglucosamine mutase [Lignipirellula cremea]